MSKKYAEINGEGARSVSLEMREYCKRPGKRNEDGSIKYFTEQHHKQECDINHIIKKYDKNGVLTHVTRIEATYGDTSGEDYKQIRDKLIKAQYAFLDLPAKIRSRFDNDFTELIAFMDNPENRDEAIKLGLIKESWAPEQDGIGEHIVRKDPESEPETEVRPAFT